MFSTRTLDQAVRESGVDLEQVQIFLQVLSRHMDYWPDYPVEELMSDINLHLAGGGVVVEGE